MFLNIFFIFIEERTRLKINYDDWLGQKQKEDEVKNAVVRAEKAAKKLEEEKRYFIFTCYLFYLEKCSDLA